MPEKKLLRFAKEYGRPFVLYDENGIRNTLSQLYQAFSVFPEYRQYFPIYMNTNPTVLRLLHECGCGVRCENAFQLRLAADCGFSGEDILFAPMTFELQAQQLAYELDATFVIDGAHCIPIRPPKRVLLSLHADDSMYRADGFTLHFADGKNGMPENELLELANHMRQNGTEKIGIFLHLLTNDSSESYLSCVAKVIFRTARRLKEQFGIEAFACNFADGVGSNPKTSARVSFEKAAQKLLPQYEQLLPAGFSQLRIETALGRSVLLHNGILVAPIALIKQYSPPLIVLELASAQIPDAMPLMQEHHVTVLGKHDPFSAQKYRITGFESHERRLITRGSLLPEPEAGDFLILHNFGVNHNSIAQTGQGYAPIAEFLLRTDGTIEAI